MTLAAHWRRWKSWVWSRFQAKQLFLFLMNWPGRTSITWLIFHTRLRSSPTVWAHARAQFHLHKSFFRGVLCLRYNWDSSRLPSTYACNNSFTVEHSLSCPHSDSPILRHNELRNITASLLNEVCSNVSVEPYLQPLSGEQLSFRTSKERKVFTWIWLLLTFGRVKITAPFWYQGF